MPDTPETVHGRLLEAVHISGYTFERACGELEWLLDEDRWKRVGGGFDDINDFLATVDFSEFKIAMEQRKGLARRLAALQASQRATARMLGVDKNTVRHDLGIARGDNSPLTDLNDTPAGTKAAGNGENSPWFGADVDPTREAKRVTRNRELTEQRRQQQRPTPDLPVGTFRLIYADPPWRYEHIETETRAIENQYPTMDLDAICALDVPAADDAVLFLWATSPKLGEAMEVITAWRFTYRTCAVWDKERIGMNHFRQQHELLLVAARGALPVPIPSARQSSIIRARRGAHSQKPTAVYTLLESMYPIFTDADRLELFSRTPRRGWTAWGNHEEAAS